MSAVPNVLFIETTDFVDFPAGGQRAFALQMMKAFGTRLALVGLSTDNTPVGRWVTKDVDGQGYDCFAFARVDKDVRRPLIPVRLSEYYGINRCRHAILGRGIRNVFVRSQHLLAAVVDWGWDDICYYFPGTENPLSLSRYRWAKPFANAFDAWFLPKVSRANTILAAADTKAIEELVTRSNGTLERSRIIGCPTRVDTSMFHKGDRHLARQGLGIPQDAVVLTTTGRIHWAKGWKLLMDAFHEFASKCRNAQLYFVGDGDDRSKLEAEIRRKELTGSVVITGVRPQDQVSMYLRASDLFIMGSEKEGWSTSLVEALATYLPLVSTNVSSAHTVIRVGVNGYVVDQRDPSLFCRYIFRALQLAQNDIDTYSSQAVETYALRHLARDLGRLWQPLR